MKLPLREPEQEALREDLRAWDGFASSALLGVEAVRACARYGPEYAERAREGLDGVALLPLDDAVLRVAAGLEPLDLRSLDALHLASALTLADDLGAIYAYDSRLAAAAATHGIDVRQPR